MPPSRRAELCLRAALLRADGLTQAEIGRVLGISRSYAAELVSDPEGVKRRARRESYGGVCERCGGETRYGGTSRPPRICASCTRELATLNRKWTRDKVVDAIRRYAAAHGRAPTATAWRRADRENGYPPASSVFCDSGPFDSWADAIEAAGFPRPRVGHYDPAKKMARCRRCRVEFSYRSRGPTPLLCDDCKLERKREFERAYRQRPDVKAKMRAYRQRPEVRAKYNAFQREYKRRRRAGLENVAPTTKLSTHPQPAS